MEQFIATSTTKVMHTPFLTVITSHKYINDEVIM